MSVGLTITTPERDEFALSVSLDVAQPRNLDTAHQIAEAVAALKPQEKAQLWIEQATRSDDLFAGNLGFTPYRDLWRMQRALPAEQSSLATRAFVPGTDEDAFLQVNNRAFFWHPEQGNMTMDALAKRMEEKWFDPAGFRLHEQDGRLVAFCWTKVHPDQTPPAGEIYAIAVDPHYHGQGLGKPMTLAGLNFLHHQGLTLGFLYVESDNDAAVATYRKLGFVHHSTNRAYQMLNPSGIAK